MSAEVKITTGVDYANGEAKDTVARQTRSVDQALKEFFSSIVSVTTSETDLAFTGITTLGYVVVTNLDATNYVQFGPKSAGAMVAFSRLKAGEQAIIPLEPGITWRWIANTATVKVHVKAYGR